MKINPKTFTGILLFSIFFSSITLSFNDIDSNDRNDSFIDNLQEEENVDCGGNCISCGNEEGQCLEDKDCPEAICVNAVCLDESCVANLRGTVESLGTGTSADHSCLVLKDGSARCWGYNISGQLGQDHEINLAHPCEEEPIPLFLPAKQVVMGSLHSCALLADGMVSCWGDHSSGQLGQGNLLENDLSRKPLIVPLGNKKAKQLTAGAFHTCALLSDGNVRCWGGNWFGMLGLGRNKGHFKSLGDDELILSVPVVDLRGIPAVQLSAGAYHTCALLENGRVRCWGLNSDGQLGSTSPIDLGPMDVIQISAGLNQTCALLADQTIHCWGEKSFHFNEPNIVQVSVGFHHACALSEDGTVSCWGNNATDVGGTAGRLGNDDAFSKISHINLGSIPAIQISSGNSHTCALLADGSVRCWGCNAYGQSGSGTFGNIIDPTSIDPIVQDDSSVEAFTSNLYYACVLLTDGDVRCWSRNDWVPWDLSDILNPDKTHFGIIHLLLEDVPPVILQP